MNAPAPTLNETDDCEHDRVDGIDGAQWCEDCGAEVDEMDADACDTYGCDGFGYPIDTGSEWLTLCDECEAATRPDEAEAVAR